MHPEQKKAFSRMTPAQKLRLGMKIYWDARALKAAAMRHFHPDWTEEQVQRRVKEIFLYARS